MSKHLAACRTEAAPARARYRGGDVQPTAGVAPGMTQVNIIALLQDWAWDFLLFAQRSAKACPVLDVIDAGGYRSAMAEGADIRSDLPLYSVWRNGTLVEEIADATGLWHDPTPTW